MPEYPEVNAASELVAQAGAIVIVQADNPDIDSLASSLALEEIFSEQGKQVTLYCGVDIPSYMAYLPGADRVINQLPNQFDLSIIVDTSSDSLLEQMNKDGSKNWLAAKPCIIIDHHATEPTIGFAKLTLNHPAVATGEVIYELARQAGWKLNDQARDMVAIAILSDSLGLTSEATTARSIHIIAELVESGVILAKLENARRETMRREPELIAYKGRLLERVEFSAGGRLATVTIPQEELDKYSPLYNPSMLVLDDMRLARGVDIVAAFKTYKDGKVTCKIRSNYGKGISDKLAERFGGGGHRYAAGFKITDGRSYDEIKTEFVNAVAELLDKHEEDNAAA